MRKLIFAALLIVFAVSGCGNSSATDSLDWYDRLEDAVEVAKSENKNILINFTGSDWCQWCKKLSAEVFTQKEFENYANDNLVLVKLDFPRSIEQTVETKMYNNSLAQRFGVRGFPTIVLLNRNGELIGITGYQPGGAVNYINHLKKYFSNS
ncbi:MAG: hypothetical protein Kow0098_06610 [Ignavibacteriaceae bacterium]